MLQGRLPAIVFLIGGMTLPQAATAAEKPLRQIIDAEVRAVWEREKVQPAGPADDATFLRRVYLDLAGTVPTAEEARQFLQDPDPKKREKLIDRLLDDPRFADHQANVWDQVLFGRNPPGGDATRRRDNFKQWLTEKFAKNTPYDQWVRELLLAESEGPALFYVQFRGQPEETTMAVSRIFLGMQLQCARCHDHPFEKWKQREFYGMAAFFARLVVVDGGGPEGKRKFIVGEKSTGEVMFTGPVTEQKPGQKGEPIKPKFLGGNELDEPPLPQDFKEPDLKGNKVPPKPEFSRKGKLAAWATAPDNPYLSQAVANRVWAQFLGRGLAHPVDNLSDANPPSHLELLQALTRELAAHQFDLKWYIRELVNSDTYQLASTGAGTETLPKWFERARLRPLSAEEMLSAMRTATGFDVAAHAAGQKPGEEKLPSAAQEYFVRYFGEPTDGRGEFQASLSERLFMSNSGVVRQFIQRKKGNLADAILTSNAPWEERVDQMFLSVLSRPPKPEERKRVLAYLTSDPKAEPLVEEVIWVLLNSSEFRFNH